MKFYRMKLGKKKLSKTDLVGSIVTHEKGYFVINGEYTLQNGFAVGPVKEEITDEKEIARLFGNMLDLLELLGEEAVLVSTTPMEQVLVGDYSVWVDDRETTIVSLKDGVFLPEKVVSMLLPGAEECGIKSMSVMRGGFEVAGKNFFIAENDFNAVSDVCQKISEILALTRGHTVVEHEFGNFEIRAGDYVVKRKQNSIGEWINKLRFLKILNSDVVFHTQRGNSDVVLLSGRASGKVISMNVEKSLEEISNLYDAVSNIIDVVWVGDGPASIATENYVIDVESGNVTINLKACDEKCVGRVFEELDFLAKRYKKMGKLLQPLLSSIGE